MKMLVPSASQLGRAPVPLLAAKHTGQGLASFRSGGSDVHGSEREEGKESSLSLISEKTQNPSGTALLICLTVALGSFLHFSGPQCPHLESGNNSTYSVGILEE